MFLLEDKVLFFTPFVIGAIVCINFLKADFISTGCTAASMLFYVLFNVFEYCKKAKFATVIFILPALGAFVPYILNPVNLR